MPSRQKFEHPADVRASVGRILKSVCRRAPAATPVGVAVFSVFLLALADGGAPPPAGTVSASGQVVSAYASASPVPAYASASPVPAFEPPSAAVAVQPSREQRNIARYVAERHNLAVESVQEVVLHAWQAARERRLDPLLVLAVVWVESGFDPRAQSHKGAQGLMQVLTRVHVDKFEPFGGLQAAFDPVANLQVGTRILKEYLVREGSVEGALKSYVGAALHPDDGGYGVKVLSARERLMAAAAGRPVPTVTAVERQATLAAERRVRAASEAGNAVPDPRLESIRDELPADLRFDGRFGQGPGARQDGAFAPLSPDALSGLGAVPRLGDT